MHEQILFKLSGTRVADTNFSHKNSCSLVMHRAYIHARRVKTCVFVCVCVHSLTQESLQCGVGLC